MTAPRSCRWCREVEPNDLLHDNNHAPNFALREGHCIAQDLTRNHVRFHVQRLTLGQVHPTDTRDGRPLRRASQDGGWLLANGEPLTREDSRFIDYQARIPFSNAGRDHERDQLARSIDRAAQLWRHRNDSAWLDEARDVLAATAPPPAPSEHHDVPRTEEAALW